MTDRTIRMLVVASVIGVFLSGLVAGYALGTRRADEPAGARLHGRPPPLDALLDEFTAELALSPTQRAQVETLLRDGERTMRDTFARLRPELEHHRSAMEAGIAAILTPDQRARYHQLRPDGLPRPPPPGPPQPGAPPPER